MDWRKHVVLTEEEGRRMDRVIRQNGCANISQLCKRIVNRGPLCLPFTTETAIDDINIIERALRVTQSADIVEMCSKIANGKLAVIVENKP